MKADRPDGAWLAGVCAGIARTFHWNVWVLRALFLGFLAIKTLAAVIVYVILAAVFYLGNNGPIRRRGESDELVSPELSDRNQRIRDLEKRFEDLERHGK